MEARAPAKAAQDHGRRCHPDSMAQREHHQTCHQKLCPGGDPQNKGTCNGIPEKGLEKIAGKPPGPPKRMAARARGNRISQTIPAADEAPGAGAHPSFQANTSATSSNGISTLPAHRLQPRKRRSSARSAAKASPYFKCPFRFLFTVPPLFRPGAGKGRPFPPVPSAWPGCPLQRSPEPWSSDKGPWPYTTHFLP